MTEEYECRCGCRFAYELGKYGCPNCGADEGPADLVEVVNDTTRDELIERIAELADQFACGAAGEPVIYALEGPLDFAEEVVSIVTANRDAEIREAYAVVGRYAEKVLGAIGLADRAVPEPDADLTLAYMKGYQDGQDAMRKSVDAAVDSASRETMTLTSALATLGPGAFVAYIGQEGELWWVELRLPEHHYSMTLVTACADTPDEALQNVVAKALTFAKEQEGAEADAV